MIETIKSTDKNCESAIMNIIKSLRKTGIQ